MNEILIPEFFTLEKMIDIILKAVSCTVFFYFGISTLYLLVLAIAGRWHHQKSIQSDVLPVKKRMAVLIPAYKEDSIILETAYEASRHNYPAESFRVIVIADHLERATIEKLRIMPIEVLEVAFDVSMKSRSLHEALLSLNNNEVDIVVILDADNVMESGCLEKINVGYHNGYKAVQCHRIAKNQDTPIALLGAISEEINVNLFRRGPSNLGISSAPMGSGMAFSVDLIKDIFNEARILNNPGEDREIDMQLMKQQIRMEFIDNAYVYDEKVTSTGSFEKQRIRWMEAQIEHLSRFFSADMWNAPKSVIYFNKLFQNLLLPRLLYLIMICGVIMILMIQRFSGSQLLTISPAWWISCIIMYLLVLLISIPAKFYTMKTLNAVLYIPFLMISMLKAIVKIRRNRNVFLHTSKTYTVK